MQTILIGTYTRNTSEGIYRIELNSETEKLENLSLVAKTNSPTYLEYDASTKTLYSVFEDEGQGGVGVWSYDNKVATFIRSHTQPGNSPCYVHFNKELGILDANYHKGRVTVFNQDGIEKVFQYGEGAKAHYVHTDPKTGDIFTTDLGGDSVHKYRLLNEIATFNTEKGQGPRHIAFHPTAPYLYLFTELSSELVVLRDDEFDLVPLQTLSTLPEGEQDIKSGAAIRISNDGRFVYVSNRGHDSITVFEVNDDFTVTYKQNISTYGKHPRDFNLSLDNKYVVVANKDSDNLVLYRRDTETGLLEYLNSDTHVPEAVNVIFINE